MKGFCLKNYITSTSLLLKKRKRLFSTKMERCVLGGTHESSKSNHIFRIYKKIYFLMQKEIVKVTLIINFHFTSKISSQEMSECNCILPNGQSLIFKLVSKGKIGLVI